MADFVAHIDQLARDHSILIRRDRAGQGRGGAAGSKAYTGLRRVVTTGITNQRNYFICLHEIGHILTDRPGASKLEKEAEAWEWALENALVPASVATRALIGKALMSYAGGRKPKPPAGPPQGHCFWTYIEWAPRSRPAALAHARRLP